MNYEIIGSTMQAVEISLQPGERVFTESGAMTWMSGSIEMDTNLKGGLFKSIGRALSGESLTFTYFEAKRGSGIVAFAPSAPGKIIPVELQRGYEIIAQRNSFMCATDGIDVSIHFQKKLGSGFFGGEGFIMQRIYGQGLAFLEIDGEVVEKTLGPGEILKVDTGHVAAFEASVDMDIQMVKGFKNVIFGGEGLFLTTLRGPGKVWLQTMTLPNLAGKIGQYLGKTGSDGGIIGSIGDFFDD